METVIARLLSDFENGKMTRRQLVQSLALVAIGAPVASAVAQSVATTPVVKPVAAPWKTVWLDHISFQCADYRRSVDFYTNLMGWQVLHDTGNQATVDINGIGGIIIRNRREGRGGQAPTAAPAARPDSTASAATAAQPSRPPVTAVIDHISWGIEPWDTETVRSELVKRGLTPREDTGNGGPITTSKFKSFHVHDPDGWDLQISNQSKANHDLG
ncbi:MAG TPA: VOC family protein [Gemmatimonadaceae bacterium]|nr:VOC family protein [Gemmatimonadaceae bacterium]